MASKKTKCAVPGCTYEGHILLKHIKKAHGLTREQYEDEYGEEPFSVAGKKRYEVRLEKRKEDRSTRFVSVRDTFGVDFGYEVEEDEFGNPRTDRNGKPILKTDHKGDPIPTDNLVQAFTKPGSFTPKIDPNYVFDQKVLMHFLIGLECHDRILLVGPTGSGKSTLPEQVAARLNYNFIAIDFSGGVLREDLVGTNQYHPEKGTYFQEGILPTAMRLPGTIITLDEWDAISHECSFVLQRLLDKNRGELLLMEKGGELIKLPENSCVVATANTLGLGDESGLYSHGTNVQNFAQLNRFGVTVQCDYLPESVEQEILRKAFREDKNGNDVDFPKGRPILEEAEIDSFVRTMKLARDAHTEGSLTVTLSTRDLLNWVQKFILTNDIRESATMCFLARMPRSDALAVEGIIQRTFSLQ